MASDRSPLDRAVDAVTLTRARRRAEFPPTPSAEQTLGFSFAPGDRAVDMVTGEDVTIHAGHPIADLVHAAKPHLD